MKRLFFVHEGKAAYPEVDAYRRFFAPRFAGAWVRPEELWSLGDLSDAVLWYVMGFYPFPRKAGLVIHDYRSLSIKPFACVKDWAKRAFNTKPDLRIFQNDALRGVMGFADDVPSYLLPMGVPESVLKPCCAAATPVDFCYCGALSRERRSARMIESFVRRFGRRKSFLLLGSAPPRLRARFTDYPNVIFSGRVSQEEVFAQLRAAACGVNYFPDHLPHLLQAPTKMLEYAALGRRILSNEHPMSRDLAARYGIASFWGSGGDMFRDVPEDLGWPDNSALDPGPFLWPNVIAASGLSQALALFEKGEGGQKVENDA
jgi:glycosyltransferase involved in cell wall biosynthesis